MNEPLITIPVRLTYEDVREYSRFAFVQTKHYTFTTNFIIFFFMLSSLLVRILAGENTGASLTNISLLLLILSSIFIIIFSAYPFKSA